MSKPNENTEPEETLFDKIRREAAERKAEAAKVNDALERLTVGYQSADGDSLEKRLSSTN